jgi:hypothetical protein
MRDCIDQLLVAWWAVLSKCFCHDILRSQARPARTCRTSFSFARAESGRLRLKRFHVGTEFDSRTPCFLKSDFPFLAVTRNPNDPNW